MESSTISNTAATLLSSLLDRMTYKIPAYKSAANDDVYDRAPEDCQPLQRIWLTQEARDALYDELYTFVDGQPDIDSLCCSLKNYVDCRMERNTVNGIRRPEDDVHCAVITQLCDDLARSITDTKPHTRIGSSPLSDAQRDDVMMLTALKTYYRTSFEGLNALYRLSKCCMGKHTAGSQNLGDVVDHVAEHHAVPNAYDVSDLRREYAASYIRGHIVQQMFLGMLHPVPAAEEWPEQVPAHTFLMIEQCWANAQHFVRSHQPGLDGKEYKAQVIATVQPMLQRLYKSGAWRCENFHEVSVGFAGLRAIAKLHEQGASSGVTRA